MRGIAQLSGPLALNKDTSLRDKEGLTMRVKGDGKRYSVLLQTPATESSPEHVRFIPTITGARALLCLRLRGSNDFRAPLTQWYASSFVARPGWTPIRLPFSSFRALEGDNAQLTLDPSDISALVRLPAHAPPQRNARECALR